MTEILAPPSVLVSQTEPHIFTEAQPIQRYRSFQVVGDRLALPEKMYEFPEWLRTPLQRYLRLKQRNWPAKTVQRSTRQLFNRLSKMIDFFIRNYGWTSWDQVSTRWLEDFIDAKLRDNLAATTINWDLIAFRTLCIFLLEEGYNIPKSIAKMSLLDEPRRLPRPLSDDQVRRLEAHLLSARSKARTICRGNWL